MASYNLVLFPFFLLFLLLLPIASLSTSPHPTNQANNLVRTSCVHTQYPTICLRTISAYRGPMSTPYDLARAALKVSITHARSLSSLLSSSRSHSRSKKERVALRDCVEMISDTVDELAGALRELKHLGKVGAGGEGFGWAISNAETWVSTALTDEDTCLEGFDEVGSARLNGKVIGKKVRNVAKVTSNALYMINKLDKSKGRD